MSIDEDGVKRDAIKLSQEWQTLREGMKPHLARFSIKDPFDWGHAYVNLWVESSRISPYFAGHVHAIAYPLAIIVGVLLCG